ncbi:MAG TPA: lysophospholipid acyltransferase family protein [Jiangellales bacterium]|nr:lysophospholipid acyltransferase family protein [Jiangellales bacterium]
MAELVYPPVILAAKTMFRALDLRFRMAGTEHVPRTGGVVLASNHVSYLDFIFAGFAAQPAKRLVRFMAKDAVFKHRVSGPLMRGMHHIPVDRSAGAASYAEALRALRGGEVVGVFPEATISRSFRIKEFKSGAARMSMATGTPLVPVVLWGGQRLMTKGRPRDLRTRGRTVTIRVGEPIRPGRRDDAEAVTAELHSRMAGLLDDAIAAHPDRPDGPDDRWWLPRDLGGTAPTPEEAAAMDAAEKEQRRAGS